MPIREERKLRKQAAAQGLTGEQADAYVYGTLRKMGWRPAKERAAARRRKRK